MIDEDAVRLAVGGRVDGDGAGFGVGDGGAGAVFNVDAVSVLAGYGDVSGVGDVVLSGAIDAVGVLCVAGDGDGAVVGNGDAGAGVNADSVAAVVAVNTDGGAGFIDDFAGGEFRVRFRFPKRGVGRAGREGVIAGGGVRSFIRAIVCGG